MFLLRLWRTAWTPSSVSSSEVPKRSLLNWMNSALRSWLSSPTTPTSMTEMLRMPWWRNSRNSMMMAWWTPTMTTIPGRTPLWAQQWSLWSLSSSHTNICHSMSSDNTLIANLFSIFLYVLAHHMLAHAQSRADMQSPDMSSAERFAGQHWRPGLWEIGQEQAAGVGGHGERLAGQVGSERVETSKLYINTISILNQCNICYTTVSILEYTIYILECIFCIIVCGNQMPLGPIACTPVFQILPTSRLDEIYAKFAQPLINRFNERWQLRHKMSFGRYLLLMTYTYYMILYAI